MREWTFKSYRPNNPCERFPIFGRFPIRRASPFIGSESDALAFARRACAHLSAKGVVRVEAWSEGHFEPEPLPGAFTFRIRPHDNGHDWIVVECRLQHPLWISEFAAQRMGGRFPVLSVAVHMTLRNESNLAA